MAITYNENPQAPPHGYHRPPLSVINGASNGKTWPMPRPIRTTLPPVERFTADLLPSVLHYVFDVAERQQSPVDFAAVTALCGLAAMVGNRVRIAPKTYDDWTVVPNLWGAIIGEPSAKKSPAMVAALAPVYAIQDGLREGWETEVKDKGINGTLAKMRAQTAAKQAQKAINAGDADAARNLLAGAADDDEDAPPCPRLVVNDASVEKLGELLNENPRGLLLVRDELPGFLARLEGEEYASDRAFYLESYNGDGKFVYDRIGRGTKFIPNCTLSLVGGIQPSRLAPIVRGAVNGTMNDGLIQRLQLAVWPDTRKKWVWIDRRPDATLAEAYEAVFRTLRTDLPGTPDEPHVLRFSPDAQVLFKEWMEANEEEALTGDLPSVMQAHLIKMSKTVPALALIFELVDGGRESVGTDATARALGWAKYLRTHAARLYAAGKTMAEEGAKLIFERRNKLPPQFTARDVHQKEWGGLTDPRVVAEALDVLVTTRHCRQIDKPQAAGGGRPTAVYEWHPSIELEAVS